MPRLRAERQVAPLDGVDLVLADLDGVVYRGAGVVRYAVDALNGAQDSGIRVGYVTNNASRTDASVAEHLRALGLRTAPEDIVTSPQAAVRLLAEHVPAGSRVLVTGGEGLSHEVAKAGFLPVTSSDERPAAVIQGFAPHLGWKDLAEAAFALADPDVVWVATNMDWTIPVERGIAPGNGTLVSAVHTAVGRLPLVAGKPERAIFDAAVARFGARKALMVGDRLDTDILGANRAGIASALVLTGIDRAKQLLAAKPDERPTYILDDLRGLRAPYPPTEAKGDVTGVGEAKVRIAGARVEIVKGVGTDLLRAACAAIWASGTPIYALEVPESLYT